MSKLDLTKKRDKELIPIARKILLAIAAREDLIMGTAGTVTNEQSIKYYRKLHLEVVMPMLIEIDMKISDINYLFQMMNQPLGFLNEIMSINFNSNRKIADALMYGIKDIDDMKISDLDKKLKEFAKPKE